MCAIYDAQNATRIAKVFDFLRWHLAPAYTIIDVNHGDITRNFGSLFLTDTNQKEICIHPVIDFEIPLQLESIISSEIQKNKFAIILPIQLRNKFLGETDIKKRLKGDYKTIYQNFGEYKTQFSNMIIPNELRKKTTLNVKQKNIFQYFNYSTKTIEHQECTFIQGKKTNAIAAIIHPIEIYNIEENNPANLYIHLISNSFLELKTGLFYAKKKENEKTEQSKNYKKNQQNINLPLEKDGQGIIEFPLL